MPQDAEQRRRGLAAPGQGGAVLFSGALRGLETEWTFHGEDLQPRQLGANGGNAIGEEEMAWGHRKGLYLHVRLLD